MWTDGLERQRGPRLEGENSREIAIEGERKERLEFRVEGRKNKARRRQRLGGTANEDDIIYISKGAGPKKDPLPLNRVSRRQCSAGRWTCIFGKELRIWQKKNTVR